jgi:competence protein ComEA
MVIWIPSLEDSENANQGNDGLGYFYVEIRGEVIKTGLYYVPSTTKIKDIINLAGGLTLAGSVLNLDVEELVQSGMKITVLTLEEALSAIEEEQDSEEEPDGSKININTATKEQLESLIGIGAVLAQAIIDHRAENGDFETIEDIMLVTGIKQSVYEEIKDDICV